MKLKDIELPGYYRVRNTWHGGVFVWLDGVTLKPRYSGWTHHSKPSGHTKKLAYSSVCLEVGDDGEYKLARHEPNEHRTMVPGQIERDATAEEVLEYLLQQKRMRDHRHYVATVAEANIGALRDALVAAGFPEPRRVYVKGDALAFDAAMIVKWAEERAEEQGKGGAQ